ncbi:MAG: hypothetical protein VKP72_05225 [bacterium]|nr:hypothetical protein [bacterium]
MSAEDVLDTFASTLPRLERLVARVLARGDRHDARELVWVGSIATWEMLQRLPTSPAEHAASQRVALQAAHRAMLAWTRGGRKALPAMPPPLVAVWPELEAMSRRLQGDSSWLPAPISAARPTLVPVTARPPVHWEALPPRDEHLVASWTETARRGAPFIVTLVLLTDLAVGAMTWIAPREYRSSLTLNTGIASGQTLSGAAIDWFRAGTLMGNLTELLVSRSVLEETARRSAWKGTLEDLVRVLDVDRVPQSDLIRITARSRDPRAAARLANTHAQVFLEHARRDSDLDARSADRFIADQAERARERLAAAERHLQAFESRASVGAASPEAIAELRTARAEAERALAGSRQALSALDAERRTGARVAPVDPAETTEAGELEQAAERIRQLEENLVDARERYGSGHRLVRELEAQLAAGHRKLDGSRRRVAARDPLQAELTTRRLQLVVTAAEQAARLRALDRQLAELAPRARQAGIETVTRKRLEREVTLREADYQALRERAGQTRLAASGAARLPIVIVDPAVPPDRPEPSRLVLKLVLSTLLASLVGLALAWVAAVRFSRNRS